MKFTVADLLDQVPVSGSVESETLEKIFRLSNRSEKDTLQLAIQGLEKLGVITCPKEGSIQRIDNPEMIEARLRCSSKGFCFAIRDDGGEDIYIRDHQLNHAWNGDRVLVKVTREGGRRRSPEGGVQCILERQTTSLLAHLDQQENRVVALPLDDRLLATIELADPGEHSGSLVEVKVDRYPVAQFAARGHVARPLPLDAGASGDRELLLTKANLHERPEAPRSSLKTPNAKKRQQLCDQPSLLLRSWSGEGAPALPAVHVEPHEGGSRLWVHAPTVAERLAPGQALDAWIKERGEALCLGEVWQPLLNGPLDEACRFTVGEEQDAITLRLDINAEGDVRDWLFCLTRIRPVAEITPAHLEALGARKPKARTVPAALKPIKDQIGQLETLLFCARSLQAEAIRSGVLELDLAAPELESLGDLGRSWPDADRQQWISPLNEQDPQSILAVLVMAADRTWSQHSQDLQVKALELLAPEAEASALTDVAKAAVALELPLELEEDGTPSPVELAQAIASSPQRRVLDRQLCQALPAPLLEIDATAEPGEGANDDSEVTASAETAMSSPSPRRTAPWCCPTLHAADLINQQLLSAVLLEGKDRPSVRQKDKVVLGERGCGSRIEWPLFSQSQSQKISELAPQRLLQKLNARRRQVAELRRDVVAMMQARHCEPMVGQEQPGVISGVQSYGFFVELPPSMIEGLVHVSSLNDDWYEYRSRQNRLVGRRNRRRYQLGDAVTVKIMKVDVLRNQIDLEVVASADDAAEVVSTAPGSGQEASIPVLVNEH